LGIILIDDRARLYESASGDGAVFGVVNCGMRAARGISSAHWLLRLLGRQGDRKNGGQKDGSRKASVSWQN
jgi:hypothetical protein